MIRYILAIPASWLLLLPYAAIMSSIYGNEWVREHKNLLDDYLVILSCYLTLCLLGHTLQAIKKLVDKEQ